MTIACLLFVNAAFAAVDNGAGDAKLREETMKWPSQVHGQGEARQR